MVAANYSVTASLKAALCLTVTLAIHLKLSFLQILPTVTFLFFSGADSTDSRGCLPIILNISVFTF